MTNFLIFFIVVFIVALLILWMMLDYQFTRLKRPLVIIVCEELKTEDKEMLLDTIKNHKDQVQVVDPCGYIQS
ncbi:MULTISPECIES: hypothetical protein [Acinetobacter]|uniref:hypothetical protein n=1 Tax=Acinetobacter TaxID=469 RepID=UPI000F689F27|nr:MULTISPECIES: hypothetical protein [Acinetobacter]RSC23237.1 hypothetical protein EGS47_11015 [Acinetobacter sp. FDAARGOS_515]VTX85962.1 Uncharacterised protein [Acinetobacter ursingii]